MYGVPTPGKPRVTGACMFIFEFKRDAFCVGTEIVHWVRTMFGLR